MGARSQADRPAAPAINAAAIKRFIRIVLKGLFVDDTVAQGWGDTKAISLRASYFPNSLAQRRLSRFFQLPR
jgi:hypothetical protein